MIIGAAGFALRTPSPWLDVALKLALVAAYPAVLLALVLRDDEERALVAEGWRRLRAMTVASR